MDPFWTAVADALTGIGAASVAAPPELAAAAPVKVNCYEAVAAEARHIDALALHKGGYKAMDPGFLRAALKRLHPVFANAVFIVLAERADASVDAEGEHMAALGEIAAWAEDAGAAAPTAGEDPEALRRIALSEWIDRLQSSPRALEPRRLIRFGQRAFSQNDEDGIIQEIVRRIGCPTRRFIEFGVETGSECNTQLLLQAGWSGLWMDGSAVHVAAAKAINAYAVGEGRLTVRQAFVTAENIDELVAGWAHADGRDGEVDLLSIDIDGNDYYVWDAIRSISPRIVVVEYNALYPPSVDFLVPYDPEAVWDLTSYSGASLSMLEKLGAAKGYSLVGCGLAGVNAFFVRNDLLRAGDGPELFHAPYTSAVHYEPVRHGLFSRPHGHRPGYGPNAATAALSALAGKGP